MRAQFQIAKTRQLGEWLQKHAAAQPKPFLWVPKLRGVEAEMIFERSKNIKPPVP